MSFSNRTKKALVAAAHSLNPIVIIGYQGLTEAVLSEIEKALYDHELIKIRINAENKEEKLNMVNNIATTLKAEPLKIIGHIAIFYKQSDKKTKK